VVEQLVVCRGIRNVLQHLSSSGLESEETSGGYVLYNEKGDKVLKLILPPIYPEHSGRGFQSFIENLDVPVNDVMIVLIQSGEACLARVIDGEIVQYKRIRKYMVRKSQGKSQIKHLKTKGKSRAGSRIRLAQTLSFFEEINTHLDRWFEESSPERIIYYVPKLLQNLWFDSKVKVPFELDEPMLRKVHWTIRKPDKDEIIRSIRHMKCLWMSIFDVGLSEEIKHIIEESK